MASNNTSVPLPEDKDMGVVLLVLTPVLIFFVILTTVLRVWARWKRGTLGWDDYTIIICCGLAIGRTVIQIVSVKHGNGRHKVYISEENYRYVNFLTWMRQIFLFLNIGLLKCSICLLILRIKNTPLLKWSLYAMMAGLALTNSECVLVLLAQCNPVKKCWEPAAPGKCWNTEVRIYSIYLQVAYSVITDLICALLPIVVLWNIQMARSLKFAICGLMAIGLVATATAVVRASSLGLRVTDFSYDYCIAAIWANTELYPGIVATNLSLSRSIYGYFTGKEGFLGSSGVRETGNASFGMNSFLSRRGERSGRKGDVIVGSDSSQIELGISVVKTTEFRLEEGERSRNGSTNDIQVVQKIWNERPRV